MRLEGKSFDFQAIVGSPEVLCISEGPYYKYVNGVKTDQVEGVAYTCVLPKLGYERVVVKVPGHSPVITNEQLSEPVLMTFESAICKFYRDRSGDYQLSCKADKAIVVNRGVAKS
ncbi:hypothetical protein [Alicyclobacillus sp. SP_1]|uniref:hypothetical protein n=1 Tax=Alicyclobacillus sp. SP_1 TaxID=2942475 RepID=UPI002157BF10|nr:hypothetical protein [Alicyclobacillus sp. SP_1]